MRAKRAAVPTSSRPTGSSTTVQALLSSELMRLGVADSYEGAVVLGLAAQLDGGLVLGTAYVSLSRELDRRVEDLRRRAPAAGLDDHTATARDALRAKRLDIARRSGTGAAAHPRLSGDLSPIMGRSATPAGGLLSVVSPRDLERNATLGSAQGEGPS